MGERRAGVSAGMRRMKLVLYFVTSLFSHFSFVHFCTQHILPFIFHFISCTYIVFIVYKTVSNIKDLITSKNIQLKTIFSFSS